MRKYKRVSKSVVRDRTLGIIHQKTQDILKQMADIDYGCRKAMKILEQRVEAANFRIETLTHQGKVAAKKLQDNHSFLSVRIEGLHDDLAALRDKLHTELRLESTQLDEIKYAGQEAAMIRLYLQKIASCYAQANAIAVPVPRVWWKPWTWRIKS